MSLITREAYLNELLVHTQWQHTFIFNGEYEKFIEVLAQRETIIQKIEAMNEAEFIPWSMKEKELLQQIHDLDERNTVEYVRQINEARDEVKKLNLLMMGHQQYIDPYGQTLSAGMNFDGGKR